MISPLLCALACGFDAGNPGATSVTATLGDPSTTSQPADGSTGVDDGSEGTETDAGHSEDTAASPCDDGWWNAEWSHRSRLRFRGGDHDEILVDMPVLVVLTPNRIDHDVAAADASDLRFVDVNGTVVFPHEVEHWDPAGTSFVWVRVPAVPYTDDTYSFWVYYGNPGASAAESPAQVWSAGYRGVWHMNDAAGNVRNSAAPVAFGEISGTTHEPDGKIAAGRSFAGPQVPDQQVPLGADSAPFFDGWSSFTLSFWVRPDYPDDATWQQHSPGRVIDKGGPMRAGRIWRPDGAPAGEGRVELRFEFEHGGSISRNASIRRDHWSWIVYTYDGEVFRMFRDGIETSATGLRDDRLIEGLEDVRLGDAFEPMWGTLDELRVADVGRSPVWIEAQHRSMSDELLAYSIPESCP